MSRVFEALRRAEERRCLARFQQPDRREGASALRGLASEPQPVERGYRRRRVVTLASLKGGVGKTVIAANLAVYLRNLRPQVPTLLLACDDDPLADRMFARNGANRGAACATSPAAPAIRGGRYGVYTLRPSSRSWDPGSELEADTGVAHLLGAAQWDGLVVVDTPPDLGARTRGALAASDVVLVPVSDAASLDKVAQLFALMDEWGLPRDGVHLLLSQLDLRIKYREGESRDVLALLVSEIRRRGWPLLGAFLSRTPKVASLYTKESGRPLPVAEAAPDSVVHRQFQHLADDVLGLLARASPRTALAGQPNGKLASPPKFSSGIPRRDPRRPMSGINGPWREIGAGLPGRAQARLSFGGAGRAPAEVNERLERTPPDPAVARLGSSRIDIVAQPDHRRAVRVGRGSARCLMSGSTRRAVGLVLLFVVAGPVLAAAMLLRLDLARVTMNEVTPRRPAGLTDPDLTETAGLAFPEALPFANGSGDRPSGFLTDGIALPGENVIAMLDATRVVDGPRFGLYDDGNYAKASVAFASFSPSATDVNAQVGRLSVLPVPEPSTALLLAAGLVGLGVRRRMARPSCDGGPHFAPPAPSEDDRSDRRRGGGHSTRAALTISRSAYLHCQ